MNTALLTLGIETSCDETSVSLLRGPDVLLTKTYSQSEHASFGGVVPELASRAHIGKLDRLCDRLFEQSGECPENVGLVAVTDSPGLAGALLVGVSFACGFCSAFPAAVCAGVHHLEGHICAALIEHGPAVRFPLLALVVSGGHTALYLVDDIGAYRCVGQTADDAAGEAFDKVGKLIGFAYPAGRAIDQEAAGAGSREAVRFSVPRPSTGELDFSFSGLKTAVKYHVERLTSEQILKQRPALCAGFQQAVIASLLQTTARAAQQFKPACIICSGGVAANSALRAQLTQHFGEQLLLPSPAYCTDNAAMIARAGYERHIRGLHRPPRMSPSRELSARMH